MMKIALIIAAVLSSAGLFSCMEAALISLSSAEVEEVVRRRGAAARILQRLHSNLHRPLTAILILNNIVNIAGSIVVGQAVATAYGDSLLAVVTTGLTFGFIIFSDIIPKSLGIHYAQQIGPAVAPLIWVMTIALLPVIILLEKLTNAFKRGQRKIGTETQIRYLVTRGREEGHIESDEGQLIHRAFRLNDKRAADIMTPLKDIVGIDATDTIREAAQKVFQHTFSRYPVFGSSIHEVRGIAMSTDLLQALSEGRDADVVTAAIRPGLIVRARTRCDRLLQIFRDEQTHLAIVQDDHHTVGLVTLEDVLEELVGEIEDETDAE